MSKSLHALAILTSAGLVSPAIAGTLNEIQVTELVRANDLNLTTVEGQKRLQRRVASAARRICITNTRDPSLYVKEQHCYKHALKSAELQVASLVEKAKGAKI